MQHSLTILLRRSIDYAGLFPPAAFDMRSAVTNYASYLRGPHRAMLGRFVLPVSRLREFDDAAGSLLPRGEASEPWRLSALTGPDVAVDIDRALKFNCRHWSGSEIGHALIDSVEIKVATPADIASAMSRMPCQFTAYFELPIASGTCELVSEVRRAGARAKARTGGVTATAFPTPGGLARFIVACRNEHVPFKLTAGLHHPIRGEYRVTYAPDAEVATMFGYLNAFMAAVLAWDDADESVVRAALKSTHADDFQFSDAGVSFNTHHMSIALLRDARDEFIQSFGSCSFREPVAELAALNLS